VISAFINKTTLSAALVLAAGCATEDAGVDPAECAWSDIHLGKPTPTDFGNGLISIDWKPRFSGDDPSQGEYYGMSVVGGREIFDCRSGTEITIIYYDFPNSAGDAAIGFEDALGRGQIESKSDIHRIAKQLNLRVDERVRSKEECGCAAFYPEMRGTKEPTNIWTPAAHRK
jgi:hypothetical protein